MFQSSILIDLIVLTGAVTLLATLFHRLRLPLIVGFLGAGMVVGPSGLGLIGAAPKIDALTEIGAVFLMFTLGLEFSFRKLKEWRRPLLRLGASQVLLTVAGATLLCRFALGLSWVHAVTWGLLLSLSSTAVVLKLLHEARDFESPHGEASVKILLFQDLAVIPMILLLPLLAGQLETSRVSFEDVARWTASSLGVLLFLLVGAKLVVPQILDKVVQTRSRELFFFSLLFICLGSAALLESLRLSMTLGAFFAGVMISESPYGKQAVSDILPLRDIFLGLFFASVGMLVDLRFVAANIPAVAGMAAAIFALKVIVLLGVLSLSRYPRAIALFTSLLLFQMGEFSFILADSAASMGLVTPAGHQYFLAISVLSLALTPFLYKLGPRLARRMTFPVAARATAATLTLPRTERKAVDRVPLKDDACEIGHAVIIGFGLAGRNIVEALNAVGIPCTVIDLNPDTMREFRNRKDRFVFGDGRQRGILARAGLECARLAIVTVSGQGMAEGVLRALKSLRPDLPAIVRTQYLREIEPRSILLESDVVVAELETSLEILARALRFFGAPSHEIHNLVLKTRRAVTSRHASLRDSLRRTIELPTWETLSSIRPFPIRSGYYATERTLSDLNLRRLTRVSIVSVFREGLGSTVPDADFRLKDGDVVYFLGNPDGMIAAERLMREGPWEEPGLPLK